MSVEFVLLVLSMLFFFSIIADKIGYRFGVPALLVFLAVGMLFGPDGVGKLINPNGVGYMLNISSAEALSSIALCVILFSGGMDTKLSDINPVMPQGVALATFGVLLTMGITGVLVYYIFGWINGDHSLGIAFALLIAATLSSTDSASVFSIMRTNGNRLRDLTLPSQTLVIMVRRGEDFFVPSGNSELLAGDQLLVITDNDVEMARQYQMEKEEEEQSYWNIRMLTDTKDFFQSIWHKIVHNN